MPLGSSNRRPSSRISHFSAKIIFISFSVQFKELELPYDVTAFKPSAILHAYKANAFPRLKMDLLAADLQIEHNSLNCFHIQNAFRHSSIRCFCTCPCIVDPGVAVPLLPRDHEGGERGGVDGEEDDGEERPHRRHHARRERARALHADRRLEQQRPHDPQRPEQREAVVRRRRELKTKSKPLKAITLYRPPILRSAACNFMEGASLGCTKICSVTV